MLKVATKQPSKVSAGNSRLQLLRPAITFDQLTEPKKIARLVNCLYMYTRNRMTLLTG